MAYCSKCGKKIPAGSKFCPNCGAPANTEGESHSKIRKCPSCGATLEAFETVCPYCGYELRNIETSDAINKFTYQLQKLEAEEERKTGIESLFGAKKAANEKILSLIRNFTVPNTKEDTYEFMILATSNINYDDISANKPQDAGVKTQGQLNALKARNDAWIAKVKQTYEKAKIIYGNDSDFINIQNLYDETIEKVKKSKIKKLRLIALLVGLCCIPFIALGIMAGVHSANERHLQNTVEEIQSDISAGNYDDALVKAQTLHMDDGWSNESEEHWDEQRESLIKLIKEKQEETK